ncbi:MULTISPECIES: hydrogenase nickel incorporation protein HypB [Acetomicrobium]|jgi:hydrogenase nickel incorporation protein HypB|uniref:hydrogenase nickel incorporation protein HypB n=1 Tax=Acetomicrobium TaxID=49894 RepID=UPI0016B5BC99|nr:MULTISPECIES: hydrogenase nickel incorporation protein HypB [Acetomicrobium]NLI42266.1 hydrogenase nickel incorporation protein HypB [Synergistaceae bacterium]MDR9769128.1 hydrogenase nickel incorporation protein HypB [Acetomicrobium sp.]HOB10366.1 hydrogenase nickel incorporation protein HypB [Acetomicrobium sp.]HQA35932.1 hydrogenase nickel incorporation protein HypB [Acetomicrobium sp.]HQC87791.1 hydrogenase nickel incorporation protein HypB [Acetomicrobium sp.]
MPKLVNIKKSVMAADEEHASFIRNIMREKGILMINMIGSPGSGKTTVLEKLLPALDLRCAVIEGDVATSKDAERIAATGTPVVQINTQGGCHLEAHLVRKALQDIPIDDIDVLFVENVGNLVCPAEFDLGESFKMAISSVPEGDDKPLKYPSLFHKARAVLLTKVDLLPFIKFDKSTFWNDVKKLNPKASRFELAALEDKGVDELVNSIKDWLNEVRGN